MNEKQREFEIGHYRTMFLLFSAVSFSVIGWGFANSPSGARLGITIGACVATAVVAVLYFVKYRSRVKRG